MITTAVSLRPEQQAFIEQGVAIDLAAGDAQLRPNTARGYGARLDLTSQELTVYLARSLSQPLLDAALSQDQVAVVFCLPATETALQIKGRQLRLRPITAADWAIITQHGASFVDGIVALGYTRDFAQAYMACDAPDMVALQFTPVALFDQTPGPQAGQNLHTTTQGPAA